MKWLCCSIFCTTLCGIILTASAVPIAVDTQAGAIQQSVKWLSWPWSCYTFGELAQQSIPPIYRQLIPVLQATFENPDVQPLETLDTRDLILKLRNHVDVFSLAYPAQVYGPEEKIAAKISETETVKEGSKVAETMNMTAVLVVTLGGKGEKDMFSEVRAQLDEGYETIGYFKDLGEDNITDPKMEANLRANCIKWYQGFMKQATEDDFEGYLAAPDTSNFHPHKEWSKFFWKSNPNTLPKSNDISGVAVLEQLVRIQFQDILEREQKVIGLAMILHVEAHEQFHDFRKSVRAIFDENEMFGSLVFDSSSATDINTLHEIYHAFGDLNDEWNKWWYLEQKGKKAAVAEGEKVEKHWERLKKDLEAWDLPGTIARLHTELAHPCSL
mmetsp:Transcript_46309/g.108689  ORF Transcript_46309/g.108689 Transcript_46309/m.108689 type:complete len:385 (-) Transcript_46309:116-1270(-)